MTCWIIQACRSNLYWYQKKHGESLQLLMHLVCHKEFHPGLSANKLFQNPPFPIFNLESENSAIQYCSTRLYSSHCDRNKQKVLREEQFDIWMPQCLLLMPNCSECIFKMQPDFEGHWTFQGKSPKVSLSFSQIDFLRPSCTGMVILL